MINSSKLTFIIIFVQIISFFCAYSINAEICAEKNSIDITNGLLLDNGTILKNGVAFPPNLTYKTNSSGSVKTLGCICLLKKCIRKCCKKGQIAVDNSCTYLPEQDVFSTNKIEGFRSADAYPGRDNRVTLNLEDMALIFGLPCEDLYLEDYPIVLREDGNLFIEVQQQIPPWTIKTPDDYCVDTFIFTNDDGTNTTKFDAMVCFTSEKKETNYIMLSSFMLISCVFILATLAVYAWLPELRNLHGRVLMAYLSSLLVGFLLMAYMQIMLTLDNIRTQTCVVVAIIAYFALLSAFFWLNIMCFDIWWTFSGKRGMSLEKLSIRGRFIAYAAYAYGMPLLLTAILAGLEFSDLPPRRFMPLLRNQGCFLFGESKYLYFYGPITLLCIANLCFFIMTAVKIAKVNRQTSMLKSGDSQTHDQQRNDKQRLLLYGKLFAVMGFNWILEVVSDLYPEARTFWMITDAYNLLVGLIIFVIFVCKRKIFYLIKKRFKIIRGDPMSRTQTTSSRLSNRDDNNIQMSKINTN